MSIMYDLFEIWLTKYWEIIYVECWNKEMTPLFNFRDLVEIVASIEKFIHVQQFFKILYQITLFFVIFLNEI